MEVKIDAVLATSQAALVLERFLELEKKAAELQEQNNRILNESKRCENCTADLCTTCELGRYLYAQNEKCQAFVKERDKLSRQSDFAVALAKYAITHDIEREDDE